MSRERERRGMMRYCRVRVDSLTCPGISVSLVNMHILLSFTIYP